MVTFPVGCPELDPSAPTTTRSQCHGIPSTARQLTTLLSIMPCLSITLPNSPHQPLGEEDEGVWGPLGAQGVRCAPGKRETEAARDTRNLPRCYNALGGSARPPDPQGPGASPPGEPGTGRCPGRGERPVPGAQRSRAPGAGTQPGTGISVLGAATGPGIPAPICFWFLPTAPEPPPAPPPRGCKLGPRCCTW